MENFEYGLPVAWLVDFADRLNNVLNFKKYDVDLDMLELPSTQDNVRLLERIKNELSNQLLSRPLKSSKTPIFFDLAYPDDCLGIVSFNSQGFVDADLIHDYFVKIDILKEDAPKSYYEKFVNQWIDDANVEINETEMLIRQVINKYKK